MSDRERRIPDPWGAEVQGAHTRVSPQDDGLGLGGRRHPLLRLALVWIAVIGIVVGLSFVLPTGTEAIVALAAVFGLLCTVRL